MVSKVKANFKRLEAYYLGTFSPQSRDFSSIYVRFHEKNITTLRNSENLKEYDNISKWFLGQGQGGGQTHKKSNKKTKRDFVSLYV